MELWTYKPVPAGHELLICYGEVMLGQRRQESWPLNLSSHLCCCRLKL